MKLSIRTISVPLWSSHFENYLFHYLLEAVSMDFNSSTYIQKGSGKSPEPYPFSIFYFAVLERNTSSSTARIRITPSAICCI